MGVFDQFPYTNFHELNLDWILQALKEIEKTMDQFVSINALKYADPIQWDITSQYEKNTIVIEPNSGTAYISVQAVPSGVSIANTDYWTVVFDLGLFVVRAAKNLATKYEEDTTNTATQAINKDEWFVWGDTLYRALSNIIAGDQFVIGSNIEHFTIESVTGHLEDLNTTDKTNLVNAINEVLQGASSSIGDLNDLLTTDKSTIVNAINEIFTLTTTTTGDLNDLITTDKSNLVNAINENVTKLLYLKRSTPFVNVMDYGAVGDGSTDDTQAFLDAVAAATSTNHNTVYIPNGYYRLSQPIELDYCTLLGDQNSIIAAIDNVTHLIEMGHEANIDHLRFIGRNDYIADAMVYIKGNKTIVNNCLFEYTHNGIVVGDVNTIPVFPIITNTTLRYIEPGYSGIIMRRFSFGLVSNIEMSGDSTPGATQCNEGIAMYWGDTMIISNVNITHCGRALRLGTPVNESIFSLFVVNSLFDNAGTTQGGTYNPCCEISNTGTIYNVRFTNCWFGFSAGANGCEISGSGDTDMIVFSNCDFSNNANNGLTISNTKRVEVTNCILTANTYCGIQIGSNVNEININNNIIGQTGRGTNGNGIKIDAGSGQDICLIVNNIINGNTYTILDNGGTITNLITRGNYPDSINGIQTDAVMHDGTDLIKYYTGSIWSAVTNLLKADSTNLIEKYDGSNWVPLSGLLKSDNTDLIKQFDGSNWVPITNLLKIGSGYALDFYNGSAWEQIPYQVKYDPNVPGLIYWDGTNWIPVP